MSERLQQDRSTNPRDRIKAAAKRALKEAEVRRSDVAARPPAKEIGGPSAPEPTRYGDWERKGIASDF